jgi:hypothetical protein
MSGWVIAAAVVLYFPVTALSWAGLVKLVRRG